MTTSMRIRASYAKAKRLNGSLVSSHLIPDTGYEKIPIIRGRPQVAASLLPSFPLEQGLQEIVRVRLCRSGFFCSAPRAMVSALRVRILRARNRERFAGAVDPTCCLRPHYASLLRSPLVNDRSRRRRVAVVTLRPISHFNWEASMKLPIRHSASPYMKPDRLADLMAAIQTMAFHGRYRRSSADWAALISGDTGKESHWKAVFDEHPEFFRPSAANPGEYALVWRRARSNQYHRKMGRILELAEIDGLSPEQRNRYLSRPPVPEAEVKTLLDTAINLHQKEVEARRERRWWITPVIAIVAALGSFLGAIAGHHWAP
jgi:hypothetical protein